MSPRKLRSGRRQFPGGPGGPGGPGLHGGTDQEWEQAMRNPDVQRALRDPAIQHALYQNLQSSVPGGMASVVPPPQQPPLRMQGGGAADPSLSPEQAAEREAGSRSPAQVAQMQRLGFNPDTASPNDPNRPLRFQFGGTNTTAAPVNTAVVVSELQNVAVQLAQPNLTPEKRQALLAQQTALMAQMQQGAGGASGLSQMVNPPSMGNTLGAVGMGALMGLGTTKNQGLAALVGAGMAGGLNYLVRKYGKAAQAKQAGQTGGGGGQTGGGGGGGYGGVQEGEPARSSPTPANTGAPSVSPQATTPAAPITAAPNPPQAPEPTSPTPRVGVAPSQNPIANPSAGATVVEAARGPNWRDNVPASQQFVAKATPKATTDTDARANKTDTGADTRADALAGSGPSNLLMANGSRGGPISSTDGGKTWTDSNGRPDTPISGFSGITDIGNPGAVPVNSVTGLSYPSATYGTAATPRAAPASQPPADVGGSDLSAEELSSALFDENLGFQRGGRVKKFAEGGDLLPPKKSPRAVLLRKPAGHPMAIPVLHTTIVIAATPKKKKGKKKSAEKKPPEKKKFGGSVTPRKPHAIPPERGPQDHEDRPRAHGRVQVPRGSGAAIKGKRFGGIY